MFENKISKIWEELSKEKITNDKTPFIRKDFKKSKNEDPVYFTIARSFPENDYGVLLETNQKFFPKDLELPIFENFEIKVISNVKDINFIWFFLKKGTEFQEQFELICLDIIDKSLEENDQIKIIYSFVNNIRLWQELLKEKKSELSDSSLKGLYAELYFLSKILFPVIGIRKSVISWKPYNKTHDFVYNNVTVEIKSTTSIPPKTIKINSLKQLDETSTGKLFLFILQLAENAGESVPELIHNIRADIKDKSPEDFFLFERKLFNEKYNEKFKEKYLKRKFFKNNEHIYLIEKDFPRIREKDLIEIKRLGIIKANYEISLIGCEKYKIDLNRLITEIQS